MALPRLKRRREFLRVAGQGKRAARPGLLLQALGGTEAPLRVGFTATKKLGNAVVRNRAKRRLRAAAHEMLHGGTPGRTPDGWDLVLVARDGAITRPWSTLLGDLRGALRQTGVTASGEHGAQDQASGAKAPEAAALPALAAAPDARSPAPPPSGHTSPRASVPTAAEGLGRAS